jgi:hypothetical protein
MGALLGGTVTHFADTRVIAKPPKGDWRARVVQDLTQEVGLTPDQQQKMSAILEETKKNYDGIFEVTRPQMEKARQEGRARMRSVLTEEQLPKFEDYLRRLDERRRTREGGR